MDMTLINRKEPYKAYLLKLAEDGQRQEQDFNYAIVSNREYSEQQAGIPLQFTGVVRTIRTSEILPFAIGDKIKFNDCIMRISGIREEADEAYAQFTRGGYKVKALIVVLSGGSKL